MILNILTFIVFVPALVSSVQIGRKQYELSKWQAEAQNKVELYYRQMEHPMFHCKYISRTGRKNSGRQRGLRIGKTVFGRLHISRASAVQSSC